MSVWTYVRLDKYAVIHLRRNYMLTPSEGFTLLALVLGAEWMTARWTGELRELVRDVGASRNTVAKSLRRLEQLELVDVLVDFAGGQQGLIFVAADDTVVQPESRVSPHLVRDREAAPLASPFADNLRERSEDLAKHSPTTRTADAQSLRETHALTCDDPRRDGRDGSDGGRDSPRDNYGVVTLRCSVAGCDEPGAGENDDRELVCETHRAETRSSARTPERSSRQT